MESSINTAVIDGIIAELSHQSQLTDEDARLLRESLAAPRKYRRGSNLEAQAGARLRFITSGWACLARTPAHGRPQIFGVLIPGDPIDLACPAHDCCGVVALTSLETIEFELDRALNLTSANQPGNRMLRRVEQTALSRLIDQIVRLGAPSAYEALAHFLLDLHERLDRRGLVEPEGAPMPLAQATIAQALGVTPSHVNRTLQELRRDGLLELSAERLRVSDLKRLAVAAGR